MKFLIFIFIFCFFLGPKAFARTYDLSTTYLSAKSCPTSFEEMASKSKKNKFDHLVHLYKLYPCFPKQSLTTIEKDFSDQNWILNQISKTFILADLSLEEELEIKDKLLKHVKNRTQKERSLIDLIDLRKKLNQSAIKEEQRLYANFPSHNPQKLKYPDLKLVKDFKRRGLNTKALEILKRLHKRNPYNYTYHRQLISTQKNIKRNQDYLFYSQRFVNLLYKTYKKNRNNRVNRSLYQKEALRNIRRIWTYESTQKALTKLQTLVKYHCRIESECSEHYWIMGRIHEEIKDTKAAHKWLLKAAQSTPRSSSEYINRVWNLVWLESKHLSKSQAFNTAKGFIHKLPAADVSSKLYFWMSQWAQDEKEKTKYISLIRTHHPLSFYLWSPLALGFKTELKTTPLKKIKKIAKTPVEKNLLRLIELKDSSLTRSYVYFAQKQKGFKKSLSWKKLKALSGMYADLLADLEAGKINMEDNLQFFFSRSYKKDVSISAKKFKVNPKLIWSIIRQESNFDTYARSWADAFGLMQVLPKRAINYIQATKNETYNYINPFKLYDPNFNIQVGAWLLKTNSEKLNSKLPLTIASYNASIEKVKEWEKRFYKGDWLYLIEEITYRETRKYVKLVLRNMEIYEELDKS